MAKICREEGNVTYVAFAQKPKRAKKPRKRVLCPQCDEPVTKLGENILPVAFGKVIEFCSPDCQRVHMQ